MSALSVQPSRSHEDTTGKRTVLAVHFACVIREGTTVAYVDEPRHGSWRDVVWLLMTAAGMLLFAFAALSV